MGIVSNTHLRWGTEEEVWLLLEGRGDEIKLWLCWGVDEWLVAYTHVRWPIEQFHNDAKQVLGMDHFEGRTWTGWNHHVSVVLLTYAFLVTERTVQGVATRLPPFSQVSRSEVYERAIRTVEEQGVDQQTAQRVAEAMIRGSRIGDQPPE